MKRIYIIATILMAFYWIGCSKGGRIDFVDPDAPAPSQILNIKSIPVSGGANITYKIPNDPNLSYIKAVYEIQPGVFREAKSSKYTDTLKLVGYGDTLSHDVKIYSVGYNEKESEPVIIKISPKTPPIINAFKNLIFKEAFGGVSVSFKNPDKADLSIVVMRDSAGTGIWSPLSTFYTSSDSAIFATRGLDSIPQKFALFIRDRWNNKSDTIVKILTPLFEQKIPKTTWKVLVLPTDQTELAEPQYQLSNMWDGSTNLGNSYASSNASILPQWFTIDLGKKVLISRFKENQPEAWHLYTGSAVKIFELYGSNNPDPNGGWNNWELLGIFTSRKPSGLPLGQLSDEDRNYGNISGEDFEFKTQPAAVRYVRWKTLETYSSTGQVVIAELSFFGKIIQ